MSNKYLVAAVDMSYIGPGGTTVTAARKTVSAPYQSMNSGFIDVPALAAKDTAYDVPFGEITVNATAVRIDNNTDVRLCVKMNGGAAVTHTIMPGGSQLIVNPVTDAGTVPDPLTAIEVVLGAAETAAGTIDYWVFGDPT